MKKTKYLIYGGGFEWMDACLLDLKDQENVLFINKQIPYKGNVFGLAFAKLCYGLKRAPHVFVLPFFRKILFIPFSQRSFLHDADRICLIIYDQNRLDVDFDFLKYMKKTYGDAIRFVYCFTNTYEKSHIQYSYGKGEEISKYYDLVFSYNKRDCVRYGFCYYPLLYSKALLAPNRKNQIFDCVFVGASKDRLDLIHNVLQYMLSHGLKCKFYVVGVEEKDKLEFGDSIEYNKPLSYRQYISLLRQSRVVLDINQGGASGMNLRVLETIFNGAKLLTNNVFLEKNKVILSNSFVFDSIEDIDLSFFRRPFDDGNIDLLEPFFPTSFLQTICNELDNAKGG